MSISRDPQVGVKTAPPTVQETTGAGPLTTTGTPGGYVRPAQAGRSKIERIGFWLIVVAAVVVLFVALGILLPPIVNGLVVSAFTAAFVGLLTMLNLPRPADWGNKVLGRKMFPVVRTADTDLWRLTWVNMVLTFVFVFFYTLVAEILHGPFIAGLIVFGGVIVAGVFYNRVRRVVVKP